MGVPEPRSAAADVLEFVAETTPGIEFVIEPLVTDGGIMLVFGTPGVGKSWLAEQFLFDLATGTGSLFHVPHKRRAIYVTTELSEAEVRYRTSLQLRTYPTLRQGMLWVAREGVVNLHKPAGWQALLNLIDESSADVVCVDPLLDAVGGRVMDYETMVLFFQSLRETKRTFIIVHHSRKAPMTDWGPVNMGQDEATGAIVSAAKASAVLQLRQTKKTFVLSVDKARHAPSQINGMSIPVSWDVDAHVWKRSKGPDDLEVVTAMVPIEGIELPSLVAAVAAAGGRSQSTARRSIELAEKARLIVIERGKGAKPGVVRLKSGA